jgi:hypothetical protein
LIPVSLTPKYLISLSGLVVLSLLLALAFRDLPNWNLVLLLLFSFSSGFAFGTLLKKETSLPIEEVLLIGFAALSVSLGVGQAIRLDNLALLRVTRVSCWLYLGIWVLLGLGTVDGAIRASLGLVGSLSFSLSVAIWSSNLKGRLSLPTPALALELYLLSINLIIAGWALLAA